MRVLAVSKTTSTATSEAIQNARKAEAEQGMKLFEQGLLVEGYMDAHFATAYMIFVGIATIIGAISGALAIYDFIEHRRKDRK